jgi:hypothetical protein
MDHLMSYVLNVADPQHACPSTWEKGQRWNISKQETGQLMRPVQIPKGLDQSMDLFARTLNMCGVECGIHPPFILEGESKDFVMVELGAKGALERWPKGSRLFGHSTTMSEAAFGRWVAQGLAMTPGGGASGQWTVPTDGASPQFMKQMLLNLFEKTSKGLCDVGWVDRESIYTCGALFGTSKGQCPSIGSVYGPLTILWRTGIDQSGWQSHSRFGSIDEHMASLKNGKDKNMPYPSWTTVQEVLWRFVDSKQPEQWYVPPWCVVPIAFVIELKLINGFTKGLQTGWDDLQRVKAQREKRRAQQAAAVEQ